MAEPGRYARHRDSAGFLTACAAIGLFSLWLRSGFPVQSIPNARFDDALFVYHARTLAAGHWLGAFDDTTLVKGMFYPLFIAASFVLGVPLKIAEQLAYLAACFVIALVLLRGAGLDRRLAGAAFLILALNPVLWSADLARVIREGLYIGEALALVGLATALAFPGERPLRRSVWLGLLAGLTGGAFWLTREEGVWLAPPIAVLAAASLIQLATAARPARRLPSRAALRGRLLPWVAALATGATAVAGVAAINKAYYGVFETTEVTSGAFRRAYGALSRITPEHWQRYVVFPADARARAYAVSDAARELAGSLDGAEGAHWRQTGCATTAVELCDEILAGWFQWALRDAVAAAGHYRSATDSAAYYDALARQIDDACERHAIACGPARATLAPPFRWTYLSDTARVAPRIMRILLGMGGGQVGAAPVGGADWAVAQFADVVGPSLHAGGDALVVEGVATAANLPGLEVRGRAPASSTIELRPDADAAAGPNATLFSVLTDCPPDSCELVATAAGDEVAAPLAGVAAGLHTGTPRLSLTVTEAHPEDIEKASRFRRRMLAALARPIALGYAAVVPAATVAACLGLLAMAGLRRCYTPPAALLGLVAASGAAVASRVLLLAYLDVTAIPSARLLYVAPASPFVLLFAFGGTQLSVAALLAWRRGRR